MMSRKAAGEATGVTGVGRSGLTGIFSHTKNGVVRCPVRAFSKETRCGAVSGESHRSTGTGDRDRGGDRVYGFWTFL